MADQTAVLVHGAWHGSWAWEEVLPQLAAAGIPAVAVDLPFTGFADDVALVEAVLDDMPGTKILVGHSYGGHVISQAAHGRHDIGHLVYLAAFQLEPGEDAVAMLAPPLLSAFQLTAEGTAVIESSQAVAAFYDCCDASVADQAVRRLRPFPAPAVSAQTVAAWKSIPSTYVICKRDGAISPQAQEAMSMRANLVKELDTDHSPMLSTPTETAAIIRDAVKDLQSSEELG